MSYPNICNTLATFLSRLFVIFECLLFSLRLLTVLPSPRRRDVGAVIFLRLSSLFWIYHAYWSTINTMSVHSYLRVLIVSYYQVTTYIMTETKWINKPCGSSLTGKILSIIFIGDGLTDSCINNKFRQLHCILALYFSPAVWPDPLDCPQLPSADLSWPASVQTGALLPCCTCLLPPVAGPPLLLLAVTASDADLGW